MRINTKLNRIELLKHETEALTRAASVAKILSKHAEGDLQAIAERVADEISLLKVALSEQGKEEEVSKPY